MAGLFDSFLGNASIAGAVRQMLLESRLPQTLLFAGPEGVGKAALARLITAAFQCKRGGPDPCGQCAPCRRILAADLSLPEYRRLFEERAKMTLERRRESPLVVSTHPDFLIFPPDGPLQQISIEQVRKLKEYALFPSSGGRRRLFLVDRADRIDPAAANALLKTLEEPPPHLTLILTAENAYDLLPTIRSRCVPFYFGPLTVAEMEQFLEARRDLAPADRAKLKAWAQGSPGRALAIDILTYEKRRQAMLAVLARAAGAPFGELMRYTESIGRSKQETLELQLDALYDLLHDLLHLKHGVDPVINDDIRSELSSLASQVDVAWLETASRQVDALGGLARRNIQKQIALEAFAVGLAAVDRQPT